MYLQLSGVMWLSVKRECIANNTRNEGLVSKCLNCSCYTLCVRKFLGNVSLLDCS